MQRLLAVGPGCGSDRTNWVSESESHQRIERHYYGRCLHCCRGKGKCDRAEDQGTRVGYGGSNMGRLYADKCEPHPQDQNEHEKILQDDRNMIDR